MRVFKQSAVAIVSTAVVLYAANCPAVAIYQHDFTGTDSDPLNGVGVEAGTGAGTPWVAEDAWFADGHAVAGVDGFDSANAFLPFTPQTGGKYMLSATLSASGDTFNYMTLGFMNNPTVDTFSDQAGGPWMLKRAQQSGFVDEIYSALDSTANGLEDLVLHGAFAGATQMSMELNTQLSQWTVEYFINGNSVRGPVDIDPAATPITHVGISRYVSPVEGTATAFSLDEDLTPLPFRLEVDRTTGDVTIVNDNASPLQDVVGYRISSASGALDSTTWTSVTGNYDAASNGGNESVDDSPWTVISDTPFEFNEAPLSGDGGMFGSTVDLGSAWIKGLEEDLQFSVLIDGGTEMEAQVLFVPGTSGLDPFEFGDLDYDGDIDLDDFFDVFIANYLTDTTGFSPAETYRASDFNGDGVTDVIDFVFFNDAYMQANPGAAALPISALGAAVPEPQSAIVATLLGSFLWLGRGRRQSQTARLPLRGVGCSLVLLFMVFASPSQALFVINGDFQTQPVANGSFEVGGVPAWFDSGSVLRLDGDYDAGGGDELPTFAGDTSLAFEAPFDYVYLNVGIITPGTNRIEVQYDTFERAVFLDPEGTGFENINRLSSSVQVDLFLGPFLGADGSDIALAKQPAGSVTTAPDFVFTTIDTNGTGDPEGPIRVTAVIDNANFLPDTELWMRLSSPDAVVGAAGDSIQLDNVSISEVSDPEFEYPLQLQANKLTGAMRLQNNSGEDIEIDIFRVQSPSNSLDPGQWQGVQGGDWGTLGSLPQELSQAHPGSALIAASADLPLGNAYVGGENQDLVFTYHVAGTSPDVFYTSPVLYVETEGLVGDYNGDDIVNLADYVVWRNNLGSSQGLLNRDPNNTGNVGSDDYLAWKNHFGESIGGSVSNIQNVPEPATVLLLGLGALCAIRLRTRKA